MQTENVTAPFGSRPLSLALVRRQTATASIPPGKVGEKWKILRDASAAMYALGVQSNSLSVLDALLSFYPENELREGAQMVVFPSNVQLSLRAHGMASATLRRHLAILVEAGLILRKDSANGKRYARKDGTGKIERAFGFDLSPLLARSEELAHLAQQVVAERATFRRAKEDFTICRRDVRKLITAAMEEGADGDWASIEDLYVALVARVPRTPTLGELQQLLDEMLMLREEIVNRLERFNFSRNDSANDAHSERHIQNSKPESLDEFEPAKKKEQGRIVAPLMEEPRQRLTALPLQVLLKACPTVSDYGPNGTIASWRELMVAAVVVRSMLGISPSAYQSACEVMGPENACAAVACILERAHLINSPGGYLRDLVRRTERGEFSIGPMIMALLRSAEKDLAKRA